MRKADLKTYRRAFQIFVAVAFIIIPILNRSRYSMVYGNFLSFHIFGIPIADPLAVLQLTIKNVYFTLDNFIGTLLPLLLALTLGTVFCSWICPYGLFSELSQKLRKKVIPGKYKGLPLSARGFTFKLCIFLVGFAGFFVFSTTPVLNQLSTAAWYARFFQYYFGQDVISLCYLFLFGLLFIELIAGKRIWCRYICPQSILITLTKVLNPKRLRVVFAKEKCICKPGFERCDMACTLSLQPKTILDSLETECSNCGDCVLACRKMGKALTFDFFVAKAWMPDSKKVIKAVAIFLVISVLGIAGYIGVQKIDFGSDEIRISNKMLTDKRIVFNSRNIGSISLLANGSVIASGGEWALNGSTKWQWQPVGKQGDFKIIPDRRKPESFTIIKIENGIQSGGIIHFEHIDSPLAEDFFKEQYEITEVTGIPSPEKIIPASVEGRVRLTRYAEELYVLNLEVLDPGGLIKKVESNGDHIGIEGMLTNVEKWINSPQIIVSEGQPPKLPFSTNLNVIFHDGHSEAMSFETATIFDKSQEVFDDPWF